MAGARIILTEDWAEQGIQDCIDCPEESCLCQECKGPENLPEVVAANKNIMDLYRIYNEKYNSVGKGVADCSECPLEKKMVFCEGRHQELGIKTKGKPAILISEDYGLFPVDVCEHFDSEGKCDVHGTEKMPKICREYKC
ncbi:MAG: hypothetical protein NT001_01320 [Candidatus Woesearchaeota archaeon]|nr:hypothetical protein [Candidatus Woesearchaeota archaeon]